MLTMNDRMLKLATADMRTLARVDQVLTGEDTSTAVFAETDTRSCTYTDTARRLGVSRPTVYELVKAGRLDVVTMNGTNRIMVRSIQDFASGNRPPSASTVERMNDRAARNRDKARANGKRGAK